MIFSILALLSGANVAVSIILNARLGAVKGLYKGAFINYFMGLVIAIAFSIVLGSTGDWNFNITLVEFFILTGGMLGYIVVLLNSSLTPKIGILYVTILLFIGQIATGSIMDMLGGLHVSWGKIVGSILILGGLVYLVKIEGKKD